MNAAGLPPLARQLLDRYQRGLPLSSRPYAEMAEALGASEEAVIQTLRQMQESGLISRVGPVFDHQRAGGSTLAAVAAPLEKIDEVAGIITAFDEVNHNYAREHAYNLWFVVTAWSETRVEEVLDEIELQTGLPVLRLPMERAYHIDLGFPLDWASHS